ncbi:MAG: hypothetical protein PHV37_04650 [Candidatus Gastranaerophilales bacterium]|nr:hypothetical protein [Candidatus Gastranaerophilales bacterium]
MMKIPEDKTNNNFLLKATVEPMVIEELDLDLSSKENLFANNSPSALKKENELLKAVQALKNTEKNVSNPMKKLDALDSDILFQGELKKQKAEIKQSTKYCKNSDVDIVLKGMVNVSKRIFCKMPLVGLFMKDEKEN